MKKSLAEIILAGILLFITVSCEDNDDIPPAVEPPAEEEIPVDKLVIPEGPYKYFDAVTSLEYPQTYVSGGNPLFTDFPSPMFGSDGIGRLYTADASARVWNIDGKDVLYVYASHDMEPSLGCDRMDRYHVFSTEDMKTWTDHGEIMNAATVKGQDGWGCEGFMWAPDCAYNSADGLYYFFFPHPTDKASWNTTWRIGVAVSHYPDKEFRIVGYVNGMPAAIDPCVFVDDDGQAYIYNGGGGKCYGAKLHPDNWTYLKGSAKQMKGLEDFHEAAWVHKYNGKYYLSYSDNNSPSKGGNRMRYAVSGDPLGPWESIGVYMYPQGIETNHGSIVKFRDKWYAFYHNCNVSGNGTLRSVCVDPVDIAPDGSISVVRNWGTPKDGVMPEFTGEPLLIDALKVNDGGWHCAWFTKDKREPDGVITAGEWMRYSFNSSSSCICTVEADFASGSSGKVAVSVNGEHPETDGITVPSSGILKVEGLKVVEGECFVEIRGVSGSVCPVNITIVKQYNS